VVRRSETACPKYCPFCGQAHVVVERDDCYVEVGEYDGKYYEEEGEVVRYRCTRCGSHFYAG
jgi:transposase-like protein